MLEVICTHATNYKEVVHGYSSAFRALRLRATHGAISISPFRPNPPRNRDWWPSTPVFPSSVYIH
jgi:hypothetical protein